MRLLAVIVATLAVAGATAAASAAQEGGELRLAEVPDVRFPARSFLLTLPESTRLRAGQISVTENGQPVTRVTLLPAAAAGGGGSGVVLAIDTSNSMRGAPIAAATEAARVFAARRNASQHLAVVTFDGEVDVMLPFSRSDSAISGVLADTPTLAYGTRLHDGVLRAISLIREAGLRFGTVVVLSDGSDLGSNAPQSAVIEAARNANIRVFSVGLRSGSYDPEALQALALGTGATYAEATSTSELSRIYDQLGALLSNEYVLTYLSLAEPEENVNVVARVRGFDAPATGRYVSPPLPKVSDAAYYTSFSFKFWTSAFSMLLVVIIVSSLISSAILAVLRPRNTTLRRRIGEFVTLGLRRGHVETPARESVLAGAERSLGRSARWAQFQETLEIARIRLPAIQIVLWTIAGTAAAMWLLTMIGGSAFFAVFGLFVPLAVRGFVRSRLRKQRRRFEEQLADNLQVMSSALRAGHSFIGALAVVVEDSAEPSKTEFQRVIQDEQLGVPLEQGLETVVHRMDNRDLEQVAVVATLQRSTGGNTAEVLDRVTETVRERGELRRLVRTLTAQGRLSRWVVSFLPAGVLLMLTIINPGFTGPLFTEVAGRIMLAVAATMVVIGSLVIKKIIEIEV